MPWTVKLLAIAVAGYALSPIDLIPDFIPVLGYLDDLIIVPLGIWLVIALIPEDVMREYRAIASPAAQRPVSKAVAIIIVALWTGRREFARALHERAFWGAVAGMVFLTAFLVAAKVTRTDPSPALTGS